MNARRGLFRLRRPGAAGHVKETSMKRISILAIALAAAAFSAPVFGMGSPDPAPAPKPRPPAASAPDSGYSAAERAVKAKQYEDAIKKLELVLATEPRNVDAMNY